MAICKLWAVQDLAAIAFITKEPVRNCVKVFVNFSHLLRDRSFAVVQRFYCYPLGHNAAQVGGLWRR